jgi:hypothetical protein
VTPKEILAIVLALAACMAIAGWRGGWLGRRRPKRVRRATPLEQIDEDFPPEHREEAKELVRSIAVHARPEDQEMVWRKVVDGVRGDIEKLRRSTPKNIAGLERIYRLLGDAPREPAE